LIKSCLTANLLALLCAGDIPKPDGSGGVRTIGFLKSSADFNINNDILGNFDIIYT